MNRAVRLASLIIATYAALLGAAHGLFEVQQGAAAPESPLITAIGPPCQPDLAWHACFPAFTLMPTMRSAGIATLIIAAIILVWSAAFTPRRRGGLTLLGLSVVFLLVGGGFVAPALGIVAGLVASAVNTRITVLTGRLGERLAGFWPGAALAYIGWAATLSLLGIFRESVILRSNGLLPVLGNLLLLALISAAFAHDAQTCTPTPPDTT